MEINERFTSDDSCREFLERLRWPAGVECPRCKGTKISRIDFKLYWCGPCDYTFSVTAGTVFHDSHLPLIKWFVATLLLCEAKKGMSALQLKRTLWGDHKGSYKTAWYLCHRIRHAMAQCDKPMLDGKVEIDETYVGGRHRGTQFRGRGTVKEPVLAIRQRGGDLRFFHAEEVRTGVLEKFIRENVSEDVEAIFTDDLNMYRGVTSRMGISKKHKIIRHNRGIYVNGDIHTNNVESAFSLLKRGIIGTWHRVSAKHLQAYCEEMSFRFNRRGRSDLFVDTLRHMITAPVLTFEKLTAEKAA
jgi:transposase-like protein